MTTLEASPALTGPIPALPSSIQAGRAALAAATRDYRAIPDEVLERPWNWGEHANPDGVRYGIYRGAETLEAAAAEIERAVAGAPVRPPGTLRMAPVTAARWALQGRLAALHDSILDKVAKDGEWTVRQTLAHTIDGQRSYGWFSRWWVSQPVGADRPARVTPEAEAASERELPGEDAEGAGTVAEIRERLDAVVDEWGLRFASVDDAHLALPATWAGIPVDIGFRLGRWGSHIAEHTIQLDKTLEWLGHRPTEVQRIVLELHNAWGRLESRIFPNPPAGREAAVDKIIQRAGETLVTEARSARAAAEA
jgi:hypothetical protein